MSAAHSDEPRRAVRWVLLAAAALVAAGCSTTQEEAARLQLNSARIRASQLPTVVRAAGGRVRVTGVRLLSSPSGGSAIAVTVRNPSPEPVADLPITVAVTAPHRARVVLNARSTAELSYFDAHLPLVGGDGSLTWVFQTPRTFHRGARASTLVGATPSPAVGRRGTTHPPRILAREPESGGGQVLVALHNTTSVPQYQMPIFVVGRRRGRIVTAGVATVTHLGSHATQRLSVRVCGPVHGVATELTAVPTILH